MTTSEPGTEIPDYEKFDYSTVWRGRAIADIAEREIVSRWAKGGNGIELGGGFGRITSVLERRVDNMFMLDYSLRNLRSASLRLKKTTLVRTSLDRGLPFDDDVFDFVALIRVIHHVPDPDFVLSEVVRVTKPGGTFVLGIANEIIRRRPKTRVLLKVTSGGHRIYTTPLNKFGWPGLERVEIRGVGTFDNRIGRALGRLYPLAALDLATSRLWPGKPMFFVRYRISKREAAGRSDARAPLVRCTCGGHIVDGRCDRCGLSYGKIIDLVGDEGPHTP
jgi:SAM-dependent methyltransferase